MLLVTTSHHRRHDGGRPVVEDITDSLHVFDNGVCVSVQIDVATAAVFHLDGDECVSDVVDWLSPSDVDRLISWLTKWRTANPDKDASA